jgi:2-methylisocitrate lyase-like PEP mutase family enzyme
LKPQVEKGQVFAALHEHDRAFIIPNPWDVGTFTFAEQAVAYRDISAMLSQ